jgi:hypothetical protein
MPLLRSLTTKIKTKISSPSVSPSTSPTSPQVSSFEKMSGRRDQHTHTHTHSLTLTQKHEQQHQHQHQHQGAVQRPESYVRVDSFIASPPGTPKESMARREKRVSRFREELDFGDA